ncbi:MAG TPA: ABC transporter substrate-binding protein, partial [Fibrobacteres bacterium]|nr:ABC transporter substrate-binding protein [Fibrobacterota bacterium]
MKRFFASRTFLCALVLSTGFLACQKREPEKTQTSEVAAAPVAVDSAGEFDPIANTAAVPGGTYVSWGGAFPKSLNMWLDYNSFSAEVMSYLYENLVTLHSTKDEPVGVLAKSWEISKDGKTFTFHIDPRARWSDGQPVTARDVQFFYDVIMNPSNMTPIFRVDLKRFARPEIVDSVTVRMTATQAHWGNFWAASGMMAFPSHVWEGKDFNQINFEFPVVSGPYAVEEIKKERYVSLRRRADWWGRSKRYTQHKYNFERIKYRFMEDRNKALEAFQKGEFDVYPVYTASLWAEHTDFDQIKKGWVSKHRVYNREPKGFQGFAVNLRKPIFQDVRVRQALSHLLNRELMNDKLMFNQYFLLNSYYPDLYPNNRNPDAPFYEYNPDKARKLLADAGWKPGSDGVLARNGQRFEITFPVASVDLRHYNVYLEDLKKVGIAAKIEQLSQSTLSKRIDNHDFDLYWAAWGAGRLRDPEAVWHSSQADQLASNNYPGIKDKLIDSLIEAQKTEMDLGKRNTLLKRLDGRLNEIVPYVLLWQADNSRLLYWNRFGTPKYILDKFNREDGIITYWYVNPANEK